MADLGEGLSLSYIDAGRGVCVIAIHGWSQSGEMFGPLISEIVPDARIIAPDLRGHGRSARPDGGYTVAQCALDIAGLLDRLQIDRVVLLGHSMGCGVIWSFIQLFGSARILGLILIDQAPTMLDQVEGRAVEWQAHGALFTIQALARSVAALRSPFVSSEYVDGMFTRAATQELREWVRAENLLFPRRHAAELLLDAGTRDWRPVIENIMLPTLVIGARAGTYAVESLQWIVDRITNARLCVFDESQGGSHLVFIENPRGVAAEVRRFLGEIGVGGETRSPLM
jgi:pimeloyl-ACP methyl ester carboxylesterase